MNDMALRSINGLSLCSGIAGIELGLKLVLGDTYHTIAYVEREAYAAACLVARMQEGHLDEAPVWDDLTSFDGSTWRGTVDIVTAGFPCQPYSVAGKQLKEKDPRHLWPEIARIIKECQPQCVFLENVNIRAFKEPFRDLQTLGFTLSDPYAITAAELGAPHIRRRIFALAIRPGVWLESWWSSRKSRCNQKISLKPRHNEPNLSRSHDETPNRLDRNRSIGNAVVPAMAARAFIALTMKGGLS